MNTTRTYGIEIEATNANMHDVASALRNVGISANVEGYNHHTSRSWKLVPDGSVNGAYAFELVSPPLSGQAGLDEIKKVCGVLKALGAKANNSCGMHVHVFAGDLTANSIKRLLKLWCKYEGALESLVAPSRVNKSWARRVSERFGYRDTLVNVFERIGSFETTLALRGQMNHCRYHALNLEALDRHRTVECRLHQGSTNAAKITAWVELLVGLVDRATVVERITTDGHNSLLHLLALTVETPRVRDYLAARPSRISRNCTTHRAANITRTEVTV
jgi:hypothetical protein